jgi:hypothetical protein
MALGGAVPPGAVEARPVRLRCNRPLKTDRGVSDEGAPARFRVFAEDIKILPINAPMDSFFPRPMACAVMMRALCTFFPNDPVVLA